jgi:hypothetical protein
MPASSTVVFDELLVHLADLAARWLRDDLAARRARGESAAPNVKLRFGEAADRWL